LGWSLAAAGALILGLLVRLAVGGGGTGVRSATLLGFLLTLGAWLAARVVAGPRTGLLVTVACVALLDVAALPTRSVVQYDDVQALYRTDQVVSAHLSGVDQDMLTLTVLAQPTFSGTRPTFGLAGEVNGIAMAWNCQFQHGVQRLALPLRDAMRQTSATGIDVRLWLTGSPNRESDYLLVYQSSRTGGVLIEVGPTSSAASCALA
jgi:hypothetical protein